MGKKLKFILVIGILMLSISGCSAQKFSNPDYSKYKVYTNLKKALKKKEDVKILILTNKKYDSFPKEILTMENLLVLNLTNNNISSLPSEINQLSKLEVLDLMKNNLSDLPQSITEIKNLKKINVAYNDLEYENLDFIKDALPNCLVITEIEL